MLTILGGLAEFERSLIKARTDGLARSTRDLLNVLHEVAQSGSAFKSLHDRSSLVTRSTSPSPSEAMALRSCGRSLRAPLCFSANSFVAPAAFSSAIWASSVWPSVETRQ
jgi:hypothetical protein